MAKKDPLIGKNVGRITINERIGKGGMAVIYKGYHNFLKKNVALKFISQELEEDEEFINRFLREAQAIGRINHPNIVQVYDAGELDGRCYMVMEFIKGDSLDQYLETHKMDYTDSVIIIRKCVAGLDAACRNQILHRDIKPSNIMITDEGFVKITDFGIAKDFGSTKELTETGQLLGTPHYISPEIFVGRPPDFRSDMYSLGATFFRIITGETPYSGKTSYEIMKKHIEEPLTPPSKLSEDIPESISQVICTMMAKEPEDRYSSYNELNDVLLKIQKGHEADLKDTDTTVQFGGGTSITVKKKGDTRLVYAMLTILTLIVLLCAGYWFFKKHRGFPTREQKKAVKEFKVPVIQPPNSIGMEFVLVPPGEFMMGSNSGSDDEKPVHAVRITEPFYISRTEVTQEQWHAVMGNNPSASKGDDLPVEWVSWHECHKFIEKLSAIEGIAYRLPTEVEWEYAARGGPSSKGYLYSGNNIADKVAWYKDNAEGRTHPGREKMPNELGIYDMTGNVAEWVLDWYSKDYYSESESIENPKGPSLGGFRVFRGGHWQCNKDLLPCQNRNEASPDYHLPYLGFRIARPVD